MVLLFHESNLVSCIWSTAVQEDVGFYGQHNFLSRVLGKDITSSTRKYCITLIQEPNAWWILFYTWYMYFLINLFLMGLKNPYDLSWEWTCLKWGLSSVSSPTTLGLGSVSCSGHARSGASQIQTQLGIVWQAPEMLCIMLAKPRSFFSLAVNQV